ncbi:MAG: DUF454 domain-containing protein [Bacteroidetes bacterium]|nr:DUF454 domain-containing protein [Bacteroidota bacterium]
MAIPKLQKPLLILAGWVFAVIGMIGIFIPLLPTTPLLLLSASCFMKSSDRFYRWLTTNKFLGAYIKDYREGKGISFRAKIITLTLLWGTMLFSACFVVPYWGVSILLIAIAIGVSRHILTIRPKKDKQYPEH